MCFSLPSRSALLILVLSQFCIHLVSHVSFSDTHSCFYNKCHACSVILVLRKTSVFSFISQRQCCRFGYWENATICTSRLAIGWLYTHASYIQTQPEANAETTDTGHKTTAQVGVNFVTLVALSTFISYHSTTPIPWLILFCVLHRLQSTKIRVHRHPCFDRWATTRIYS